MAHERGEREAQKEKCERRGTSGDGGGRGCGGVSHVKFNRSLFSPQLQPISSVHQPLCPFSRCTHQPLGPSVAPPISRSAHQPPPPISRLRPSAACPPVVPSISRSIHQPHRPSVAPPILSRFAHQLLRTSAASQPPSPISHLRQSAASAMIRLRPSRQPLGVALLTGASLASGRDSGSAKRPSSAHRMRVDPSWPA